MTDDPAAAVVEALVASMRADSQLAGLDGVSVVRTVDGELGPRVYSSNRCAAELDDLQELLGEGPGISSLLRRGPVLVPDLADSRFASPWVAFGREAAVLGVRSVFVFPVQVGAARLGLSTWHAAEPVGLQEKQLQPLLQLADLLSLALINPQDGDVGVDDWAKDAVGARDAVTHQATGMISAQISGSLDDAFSLLRAHAFAHELSLAEVARAVVERRVGFGPAAPGEPTDPADDPNEALTDD